MRFNVTVLPVVKLSPSTSSLPPSSAPCSGGGMAPALAAAAVAAASLLFCIAFNRVTDDEPLEMYAPWFL